MDLKNQFKQNEWELISEVLEQGKVRKWSDLAERHSIRPEGSAKQRRTAANDIWRRFLKTTTRHQLDLVTVKQTLNGTGQVLFETRKVLPESKDYSLEGLKIASVTTNPNGGEWIKYKSVLQEKEKEETIVSAIDRLFEKYDDFSLGEDIDLGEFSFSKKLGVVNLYDAHLDKLPVKSSCGVESTLEENIGTFSRTINKIIKELSSQNVDTIVFPVGNDLFHTNGMNSTTKKGTPLEYYGSPEDAYYAICDVITETIVKLATVAPNVHVIMVKGNHDEDKIAALGYWLERAFRGSNVTVDFLRRQRKYIKFGENLIGFAHGDKEKSKIAQLPLIMAQEAKEIWGTTTHRKMYLGDLHHGFEYQFLKAKDMPGVEVEYLRSVGTTDSWHEDFGFVGIAKTAYLQIFDEIEGEVSRMKFNIK